MKDIKSMRKVIVISSCFLVCLCHAQTIEEFQTALKNYVSDVETFIVRSKEESKVLDAIKDSFNLSGAPATYIKQLKEQIDERLKFLEQWTNYHSQCRDWLTLMNLEKSICENIILKEKIDSETEQERKEREEVNQNWLERAQTGYANLCETWGNVIKVSNKGFLPSEIEKDQEKLYTDVQQAGIQLLANLEKLRKTQRKYFINCDAKIDSNKEFPAYKNSLLKIDTSSVEEALKLLRTSLNTLHAAISQ